MPLALAQAIVVVVEAYLAAGAVFAMVFLVLGVTRFDRGVEGAPKALRLLLMPGVIALWPILASRWIRGSPPPIEHNSHRTLAR